MALSPYHVIQMASAIAKQISLEIHAMYAIQHFMDFQIVQVIYSIYYIGEEKTHIALFHPCEIKNCWVG